MSKHSVYHQAYRTRLTQRLTNLRVGCSLNFLDKPTKTDAEFEAAAGFVCVGKVHSRPESHTLFGETVYVAETENNQEVESS